MLLYLLLFIAQCLSSLLYCISMFFLFFVSTYQYLLCSFVHELMPTSREMFTKWRAQRWWTENYEKIMELYNVQKFNRQAVPLHRTGDEVRHPADHLTRGFYDLNYSFLST